jgi:hypothetical protein
MFYTTVLAACVLSVALAACNGTKSDPVETNGSEGTEIANKEVSLKLSCDLTHVKGIEVASMPDVIREPLLKIDWIKVMVDSGKVSFANADKSSLVIAPLSIEDGVISVAFSESGAGGIFRLDTNGTYATIDSGTKDDPVIALYACNPNPSLSESDFSRAISNLPIQNSPARIDIKAKKIVKRFNRDTYPEIEATNISSNITLKEIIMNRGNCNIFYAFKFPSGETLPLDLVYGDKIKLQGDCDPSEVTFVAEEGSATINW